MSDEPELTSPLGGRKKAEPVMSVSLAELQGLVTSAVSAALAASADQGTKTAEILAKAITEASNPKKDARTLLNEENDRIMREQDAISRERQRKAVLAGQDYCQHLKGSNPLSEWTLDQSAFAMLELDTGEIIGICTNCQKLISSVSEDPENRRLFDANRRKPGNKMARAGYQGRYFEDVKAAQRARTAMPRPLKTEPAPESVAV